MEKSKLNPIWQRTFKSNSRKQHFLFHLRTPPRKGQRLLRLKSAASAKSLPCLCCPVAVRGFLSPSLPLFFGGGGVGVNWAPPTPTPPGDFCFILAKPVQVNLPKTLLPPAVR